MEDKEVMVSGGCSFIALGVISLVLFFIFGTHELINRVFLSIGLVMLVLSLFIKGENEKNSNNSKV